MTTHVASVRPVPAVVGHQLGRTLSFPPTTQYCLDNIGIHCYSVLQYRTAYDLNPLGVTNFVADGSALYDTPMNSWPSTDPLVTSVGGTQPNLDATGNKITPDVVWNDARAARPPRRHSRRDQR